MGTVGFDFIQIVAAFLPLLIILCLCKIYGDRGESFWKAIVPFYSYLVFGRLAGDEKTGRKMMIASFFTVLFAVGFYYFLTAVFSVKPRRFSNEILSYIFFILMAVSFIVTFICNILLKVKFVKNEKDPGWVALLWIIFPPIIDIYYALIKI